MKITSRLASFFRASQSSIALAVVATVSFSSSASAMDGVWNNNAASLNWSTAGNWVDSNIADGIGSIADFSQLNITSANRTVTIDGAVASRTVGTLLIGDSDITDNRSYTIAASGGGTLTFDKGGTGAVLSQISSSFGDSISAPVILNDNLTVSNVAAVKALTLSGGITSGTAGTKTITTSTGNVAISGIIGNGSGTVAVVQDGTGALTLSGVNTFTGGLTIKNGTVIAGNSVSVLGGTGTGAVTIGGGVPSGAANATLLFANGLSYANPITVASGGTGTYTIGNNTNNSVTHSGGITLNNNATISQTNTAGTGYSGGQYLNVSTGAITGSGNLTLAGNGVISTSNAGQPAPINNLLVSSAVSTTGSITNAGTGTAIVNISGVINNASSVNQNSATSMLILSATNTYTGPTNINAGVIRVQSNSFSSSSATTVASGATFQLAGVTGGTGQTLTLSGNGTSTTSGALEAINTSTYFGPVVLAADATISSVFERLNATTLTVGTVGTTTITGSGRALTVTGNNSTTINASIATTTGTLTKLGAGTLTLSGANTYTGLTSINGGALSLNHTNALGGGGNITFGGGSLRYNSANNVDYSSRIINSTAAISIDTNGQNRTLSGGLAASNTGGLIKLGSGTLTLAGSNSYTGPTIVSGGQLAINAISALPSTIFTDVTGAVNQGGAYTGVQGWLTSGQLASSSVGAIALTAASSENIDFTGFSNLMLGASTSVNYTGTITPAGGTYRLGGGSGSITLPNANALTGTNALVVGARSGNGSSGGGVILGAANNLTGTTTVASSSLTFNSSTAGVATSDITVNRGATLAINYASGNLPGDNSATRAQSVQLNGSTLNISGNIGGNTTEIITNALTFASGPSTVNISPAVGKHALLSSGSFSRSTGSTVLFTGTSLGVNANSATDVSSANVSFGTAPTLNGTGTTGGSGGTTTVGILAGTYGDTTYAGTGLGATGGLVTYDSTNGARLLNTGTEYIAAITSGQLTLDNVRYVNPSSGAVTTDLNTATSINSLSFVTTGAGAGTSAITVNANSALQINSGVIYGSQATTGLDIVTIAGAGGLDFNGQEAVILNATSTSGSNTSTLVFNTVIGNATGLTKSGSGMLILSGTAANTFTGTTTVNGGNLRLAKTAGLNAVNGDVVINAGANISMSNPNQIPDTSNVTINGGTFIMSPGTNNNGGVNETINNLTMVNAGTVNYGQSNGNPTFTVLGTASVTGGSTLYQNTGGQLNITGLTSLSDGGTLTVKRSQSISGIYDGFVTLTGGLAITNTSSGAYTPVTINPGVSTAQIGGKLFLNGDLTFTGNTNTNTVTITAPTGNGPQGVMALGGDRTFNIGDGSATVDLTVAASIVDGTTPGGLVKTSAGTLALTGTNTYTGNTTVNGGTLSLGTATFSNTGAVDVANTAVLNLTHGLTDTVDSFKINGVLQAAGEWGAIGSGAAHQTARITGSGKLLATNGAASSDPFDAWIDTFTSLTAPADKTKAADPDHDGLSNVAEFALDGNPASGVASGKIRSRIETVGADQALVITLPVRAGAVFDNIPGPAADATINNLIYTIEGTNDLATFNQGVTEIAVSSSGMPSLTDANWTYRTFRLNGAVGGVTPRGPKGFLRVVIVGTP